jgi:NTE family protein
MENLDVGSEHSVDNFDRGRDHIISLLRKFAPAFVREQEWVGSVSDATRWSSVRGGSILFRKNDPSDCIYVVVSGLLGVTIENPTGGEHTVARLGPGEIVGEMGCITGQPRSATVRALRSSEVLAISWNDIQSTSMKDPGVLLALCQTLVQRLVQVQEGRRPGFQPRTFAVVPVGKGMDPRSFAEKLKAAFNNIGRTFLVTREECQGMTADELFQIEQAHDYLVYAASQDSPSWSQLCLAQSDEILIVAQGNTPPQSVQNLRDAVSPSIPIVLILTWDSNVQPANTADWVKRTGASRHFHVRGQADMQRAARLLTGKGFGLVLSGGGARGFAHVGVGRALREHGVDIDVIMGTSIGALMGAALALEWDDKRMVDEVREFSKMRLLNELTVPRTSLLAGRKLRTSLIHWFADVRIEDTPIPYSCVSTNLNTGDLAVHEAGILGTCLKASTAVPGVFPPVVMDGMVHVDGGVLNNMPTDLIKRRGAAFVLAVDVADGAIPLEEDAPLPVSHTADQSRLNILELLTRVGTIGEQARSGERRKQCDVLLVPKLTNISLLGFAAYERAIEAGYRSTIEKIDQIARRRPVEGLEAPAPLQL